MVFVSNQNTGLKMTVPGDLDIKVSNNTSTEKHCCFYSFAEAYCTFRFLETESKNIRFLNFTRKHVSSVHAIFLSRVV